jgi:hypothetical protein
MYAPCECCGRPIQVQRSDDTEFCLRCRKRIGAAANLDAYETLTLPLYMRRRVLYHLRAPSTPGYDVVLPEELATSDRWS